MVPFQKESKLIQTIPESVKLMRQRYWRKLERICLSFQMKHIFPLGRVYAQAITKVQAKKKSGKTQKGNSFLKGALTEAAWAASKTKNSSYNAFLS